MERQENVKWLGERPLRLRGGRKGPPSWLSLRLPAKVRVCQKPDAAGFSSSAFRDAKPRILALCTPSPWVLPDPAILTVLLSHSQISKACLSCAHRRPPWGQPVFLLTLLGHLCSFCGHPSSCAAVLSLLSTLVSGPPTRLRSCVQWTGPCGLCLRISHLLCCVFPPWSVLMQHFPASPRRSFCPSSSPH